tara:strand:- start:733 stop:1008 length:276 start_codon:yes stop_codon:yes gene_type:complete
MDEPYIPKVNDYVIWDKGKYGKDEGWVYFTGDEYITIETGVKPKPYCEHTKNPRHKMTHTLLLCHKQFWNDLKYIKSRKSPYPSHYSECED